MVKKEKSNGFSSIIILSVETIEKNVRRKSRHCLLPHTYAPRESHKSHGALKLRNLPIEGRESVGCPSSRGDYAKLHGYGIISRIRRAGEQVRRAPHMFTYADPRTFKSHPNRFQSVDATRVASRRDLELTVTFLTEFFG